MRNSLAAYRGRWEGMTGRAQILLREASCRSYPRAGVADQWIGISNKVFTNDFHERRNLLRKQRGLRHRACSLELETGFKVKAPKSRVWRFGNVGDCNSFS